MIRLPWTSGGSGVGVVASLNVMYRQQSVDSLAAQRLEIGSGSVAGAALAVPAGTVTAMVPASAAVTAATANLRTIAHPPLVRIGGPGADPVSIQHRHETA